ncbi:MAG: hypothetical protein ACRCST_13905 [Turicibacter sp.]
MNVKSGLMFAGLALTVGGMIMYASTLVSEDNQLTVNSNIVQSIETIKFEGNRVLKKYELTDEDLKKLEEAGLFSYDNKRMITSLLTEPSRGVE